MSGNKSKRIPMAAKSSTLKLPGFGINVVIAVIGIALSRTGAGETAGGFDASFNPSVTGTSVLGIGIQPDEHLFVGGEFSAINGFARPFYARFLPSGALETGIPPAGGGANNTIYGVTIQNDGKILVAGDFTSIGGEVRGRLARLNANGTLESTTTFTNGSGANSFVHAAVVQPDEKIIIHGLFTSVNGQARNNIARLFADGSVESLATFSIGTGASGGDTACVALQSDGRILVGGTFTAFNGQPRNRLVRLHPNGALESTDTFKIGSGANENPSSIIVQPDGRILLGGAFTTFNGQPRNYLARLKADGTLEDTVSFNIGSGPNSSVRGMALQADGKILITGRFTSVNGAPRNRVARLLPSGELEGLSGFNIGSGFNADPAGVMLQGDGRIQVMGSFTSVNGNTQRFIARLFNDFSFQELIVRPAGVSWSRGGSAPEVRDVVFDLSTNNGNSWTQVGSGVRIQGGWERNELSLPSAGLIRARGRTDGGYHMASSGLVESLSAFEFSSLELWRQANFGTMENTGLAANNADPDNDGLENLIEYAFATEPQVPGDLNSVPRWQLVDNDYVLTFTRPQSVNGVTYVAEYSGSLAPGDWRPIQNSSDAPLFTFYAPFGVSPRLFVRLRVAEQM